MAHLPFVEDFSLMFSICSSSLRRNENGAVQWQSKDLDDSPGEGSAKAALGGEVAP
jgi:hypothetical protein